MQISSHDGNCPDRTDYSPIPAKGVQKGKHPSLRAMFDYKTCFRVFSHVTGAACRSYAD